MRDVCAYVSVFFHRLHEGGISCPEVVLLRKHVLIMSFIGQDQRPAPKLKEATLTQEEMTTAYHQTIEVSGSHACHMYMCTCVYMHISGTSLAWTLLGKKCIY